MKKLITAFVLLCATSAFAAQPVTLGFRNYSVGGANTTNLLATCSVMSGKANADGTFNPDGVTSYALTKGGTASFSPSAGSDYKITCIGTNAPTTAATVKLFFDGSETYSFPFTSLLYRQR